MKIDIFVIDFDSTFISAESFEMIFKIALFKNPKKKEILKKMKAITDLSMKSEVDFKQNFKMRMELLENNILKEEHLIKVGKKLESKVSPDIVKIVDFARRKNKKVIVLSNSFKLSMKDIMNKYGLEIYFANKHIVDEKGFVISYDEANPMANNNGKENIIKFLKNVKLIMPNEKIMMIGDGMSDYKVYEDGFADYFMNFAINKNRRLKKFKKDGDNNFIIARTAEDIDNFLKTVE